MVKHNNSISNGHFRKHWQKYVKTDFDKSSNKKIRRTKRNSKLKASKRHNFSPENLLRPVVNNPTKMYNLKIRLGRGFSFSELDDSRVSKKDALSIGVSVDKRRRGGCLKHHSNVKTLNDYLDKINLVSTERKINGNGEYFHLQNIYRIHKSKKFFFYQESNKNKSRRLVFNQQKKL